MKHKPIFTADRLKCTCGWSISPQYKSETEIKAAFKKHEAQWKP